MDSVQLMRADRQRALADMASGIAHEFNQPLSIIRGFAENLLIARERGWNLTQEEEREHLQQIVNQVDRLADLIEHVRSFTRDADAGERTRVPLRAVIESGLRLIRAQCLAHNIDIVLAIDAEPCVWANPFAIEEIVICLLRNARSA